MIIGAEKKAQKALETLSGENKKVAALARQTRVDFQQIIELNNSQRAVYERIRGLQLRVKLLRNIRMNWPIWQERNHHIDVRLNQLQGLEQLIHFLEDENFEFVIEHSDVHVDEEENINSLIGYYVQPTGAGKTGLFAIETALADVKTLTLVPFDNLMYQTEDDFQSIGGIAKEDIGVLPRGASKDLYNRRVLISTYAGHLARMRRDPDYRKMVQEECELVWCDEGHMALGDKTQEVISQIDEIAMDEMTEEEREAERLVLEGNGKFIPSKAVKIAFTATPKLASKHVRQKFGRCIGRVFQAELVKAGINVPYHIIHTDGRIEEGDQIIDKMTEAEETKILDREEVYKKLLTEYAAALKAYNQIKKGKKKQSQEMPIYGMAFCTNHDECEKFKNDAEALGLNFEILTGYELSGGEKGRAQLKAAEQRLLNHEIDGFVTVEKLATGYSPNFMNTILWAKVTSSARTVQGIGRGGRRHVYANEIKKTHCTVIETNWTLAKNAKRGKRIPLRLTDALYDQGEDPEAICSMADGSALPNKREFKLDPDGTVAIGERIAIATKPYAAHVGFGDYRTLEEYISEARLQPLRDIRVLSGNNIPVTVYWKDEVDAIIPKRFEAGGVVDINGKLAIGVSPYARSLTMSEDTLWKYVLTAKLQPVPNVRVLSGRKKVDVYWKDEVDALLPKKLDKNGIVDINGREAVGVWIYAKKSNLSLKGNALLDKIIEAKLQPLSNVTVYSNTKPVDIYWKDEVDALLPKKLDKNGIVDINGRQAVGVRAYVVAQKLPLGERALLRYITGADLQPIENVQVLSRTDRVDVYWKNEIDALLRENGKL